MNNICINNTFENQIKDSKRISVKIIKKVKSEQQTNSDNKDTKKSK